MSFNNYSLSTHWIWNHMKSGLYLTIANGKYFVSNFTEYWTFGYLNLFFNFATLGAMHFYIRWLSIWAGNRSCVDHWEHQECNIQSWKFKKFTLVQFSFFFFFFFFFFFIEIISGASGRSNLRRLCVSLFRQVKVSGKVNSTLVLNSVFEW